MKVILHVAVCASLFLAQPGAPSTVNPRQELLKRVEARGVRDGGEQRQRPTLSELHLLYGREAERAGIELSEIERIYDAAYQRGENARPWLRRWGPRGGWILAALTLIALVFRDSFLSVIKGAISRLKASIYSRAAGTPFFRPIAMRKYRAALRAKHARIVLPFRPDKPLAMQEVYVPLRMKGSVGADLLDATRLIRDHKRVMAIGTPGSGKTMLLRNLAFRYSDAARFEASFDAVPVLLELNRFNDSDAPIEAMLVDVLDRHDFPRATQFVDAALRAGKLMLLFDGLDEVNSARRAAAARRICDFLERYRSCRAVITCRSAVYRSQFDAAVGVTVEVAEFTDQQVRTYLTSWKPYLPPGKSVESLMQTLQERPQIMLLARNPLLLTIIAFLYVDTEFELPHSRAQFYAKAINVLLDQWNMTQNRYSAAQKSMVLRHLARVFQEEPNDQSDRRTMTLAAVLREIRSRVPDLNLAPDQAEPLLNEIAERSGLLMLVDGGEHCQFAHLTLQEFMAATAFRDDADGLVTRFRSDPDAWREVVKLWCGLDVNSTALIERVYTTSPVTSFECLADALNVSSETATRITSRFQETFGTGDESLVRAFAVVASGNHPRGRDLFNWLSGMLSSGEPHQRAVAAVTLAMTNLPAAATLLAADASEIALTALTRMGDIAVPAILISETIADRDVLSLLHRIGTPAAAKALVPSLWQQEHSTLAAAYLASLLPLVGVRQALATVAVTNDERRMPAAEWVWKPFEADDAPSTVIANRVAYLIALEPASLPVEDLDPRLVVPLVVAWTERSSFPNRALAGTAEEVAAVKDLVKTIRTNGRVELESLPRTVQFLFKDDPRIAELLRRTDPQFAAAFIERLLRMPSPRISDWINLLKPVDYTFQNSGHLRAATTGTGAMFVLGATAILTGSYEPGVKIVAMLMMAVLIFPIVFLYDRRNVAVEAIEFAAQLYAAPVAVPRLLRGILERDDEAFWSMAGVFLSLGIFTSGLTAAWLALELAFRVGGIPLAIAVGAVVVAGPPVAWLIGKRRDREARNVLHGLLDHVLES